MNKYYLKLEHSFSYFLTSLNHFLANCLLCIVFFNIKISVFFIKFFFY